MTYSLVISSPADADLAQAANWYELQRKGLGDDFLMCVEAALRLIELLPMKHSIAFKNIRRAIVRRFPYAIYYIIEAKKIFIIAIHHHRRHPSNWQKKIAYVNPTAEKNAPE